jgi:hypothetical protein
MSKNLIFAQKMILCSERKISEIMVCLKSMALGKCQLLPEIDKYNFSGIYFKTGFMTNLFRNDLWYQKIA